MLALNVFHPSLKKSRCEALLDENNRFGFEMAPMKNLRIVKTMGMQVKGGSCGKIVLN